MQVTHISAVEYKTRVLMVKAPSQAKTLVLRSTICPSAIQRLLAPIYAHILATVVNCVTCTTLHSIACHNCTSFFESSCIPSHKERTINDLEEAGPEVSVPICHLSLVLYHSPKMPAIQQGYPLGVSSIGNPRQALTGFTSGSLAVVDLLDLLDISCEMCN